MIMTVIECLTETENATVTGEFTFYLLRFYVSIYWISTNCNLCLSGKFSCVVITEG